MSFERVIGQSHVKDVLKRSVLAGSLSHAYLFAGERGLGKGAMALALAQAINCLNPLPEGESCGRCHNCVGIESNTHPDVHRIAPQPSSIRIEQVRDVVREAALKPFQSRRKIFILQDAEKMTEEAANSLLKVLEEPAGHVLFLLLTANPDGLLTTVRSRCQLMRFRPVPHDIMYDYLTGVLGVADGEARSLAVLAHGNPGLARRIVETGLLQRAREMVGQVLGTIADPRCSSARLVRLAEDLESWFEQAVPDDVMDALDMLAWGCRDKMVQALGAGAEFLALGSSAEDGAGTASAAAYAAAVRAIQEAVRALAMNGNRRLVLEVLVYHLRKSIGSQSA